jgi:PPK2 family polyphosphate:nucleotide phosphotransferase
MNRPDLIDLCHKWSRPYRVTSGKFRLKDVSPNDTGELQDEDKPRAKDALAFGVEALSDFQERLYAQDQWGVLFIFQAMDAAGKDGAIKHVMSGVNPAGCQVTSFKVPSSTEIDHDYLWRCVQHLPERGRIAIFNRSYYEELLVPRVHEEVLARQKLPPELITKHIWKDRAKDIRHFEQYLGRNGFLVRKFFLHVSKREQKERFLERIDNPEKNWKFSPSDVTEREHWDEYQCAYEELIRETATEEAPWYVIPADNKWFTRIIVAAAAVDALSSLKLGFPEVGKRERAELQAARRKLSKGNGSR